MVMLQKFIAQLCTFFMMVYGLFAGTNNMDTIKKYEATVKSVSCYENTIETALPQTEIYDIITNHFSSNLPAGKTEKKAIVIGYDGCRADTLSLATNSDKSAILTIVNDGGQVAISYCGGVNYPAINKQSTSTAPGWCSMLTGEWADVHGINENGVEKSNDHLTLLTTLVENNTIDSSAFYVSWDGHFNGEGSTYIQEKQYIEQKGLNSSFVYANDDNGTVDNIMSDVTAANCSDFIFSILEYCDHTGHDTGFGIGNEDYVNAFASAEQQALNIINTIKARATYMTEDWLIIITTDHGGYNTAHGSLTLQERMTFIAANKEFADFS